MVLIGWYYYHTMIILANNNNYKQHNFYQYLKNISQQQLVLLSLLVATLQFIFRLGSLSNYGFHQDELLYMALSNHLAWGFKETPPFIAFIGFVTKFLLGDSVFAMRLFPAVCAACIVFFTGKITIALGGRFFAVLLACCGIAFSSAFLASGALFIPQVFDELCWILAAYVLIRFQQTKQQNYLLLLGLILGIGMLVKYTIALYAVALFIGLLVNAQQRKIFLYGYFWLGIAIAFILCLPNLYWQYQHDFALFKHYQELKHTQLIYIQPQDFLLQQLLANGLGMFIWIAGLAVLLFKRTFNKARFLAIAFLIVMLILLILKSKPYYAFGAYPPLFAVGAIFWERFFLSRQQLLKWAFFAVMLLPNLLLMCVVLPYLPIERTAKVFEWSYVHLNIHFPLKWEDQKIHNMNQNYADMIGWEELAQKTAKLYHSLPMAERAQTIIYAANYGEAGAIDYYQDDYGLPKLISLSSSYAIWAPKNINAKNIIYIGEDLPKKGKLFNMKKYNEITNRYARVKGMGIYLVKDTAPFFKTYYQQKWLSKQ